MDQSTRILGIDIGDRRSRFCLGDQYGEVMKEGTVFTEEADLLALVEALEPTRIVMEVGQHSPWMSRVLRAAGFEVVVLNARRLKLLTSSVRKTDRRDAQILAWVGTLPIDRLLQVEHVGEDSQRALLPVKIRAQLVESRTAAINQARGLLKSLGHRVESCDTRYFVRKVAELESLDVELRALVQPLLDAIDALSEQIAACDAQIEAALEAHPAAKELLTVPGVGAVTALTFVSTVEDPSRFDHSRDVGAWLGLTPRLDQSGMVDKALRITKAGNPYLRGLLVQSAHSLLRSRTRDCALKQWGLRLAERGVPPEASNTKTARRQKRKAVVAVARKLAVLLHRLWVTGETFVPFPKAQPA